MLKKIALVGIFAAVSLASFGSSGVKASTVSSTVGSSTTSTVARAICWGGAYGCR